MADLCRGITNLLVPLTVAKYW